MESEETSLADDHADGSIESAEDTGSGVLTSDKKEYGMIFGFAAAGALAGGLAGSGIKAGVKLLYVSGGRRNEQKEKGTCSVACIVSGSKFPHRLRQRK